MLRNLHIDFYSGYTSSYFYQQQRVPLSPHPGQCLLSFGFWFVCFVSHFDWGETEAQSSLNLHLPKAKDVKYLKNIYWPLMFLPFVLSIQFMNSYLD